MQITQQCVRACVREETCRHAPVSAEAPVAGDTRDLPVETQLSPDTDTESGLRVTVATSVSGHEVHAQTADV